MNARFEQTFKTVKIGNQIWMAENLNVSHYRNGDLIAQIKNSKEWGKLRTGAWCYYNFDEENGKTYGKLYNGYAICDPRGIAPHGWHIPSENEWDILSNFVYQRRFKAGETGFSGAPGSSHDSEGDVQLNKGSFWQACETSGNQLKCRYIAEYRDYYDLEKMAWIDDHSLKESFGLLYEDKVNGYSVRCIRD